MARKSFPQIRLVVHGQTASGRRIMRGAWQYIDTHQPHWHVFIETNPSGKRGVDWQRDDGMIFAAPDRSLLYELAQPGRAIVTCLPHFEQDDMPVICGDDYATGRMAAEYLIERGFIDYAYESQGDNSIAARRRYEGYRDALGKRGFTPACRRLRWENDPKVGPEFTCQTMEFIKELPKPVAIFYAHDTLARNASSHIARIGFAVPEQIAILSVDNDEYICHMGKPPLSSIDIDYERIGFDAAGCLDRILAGRRPPAYPQYHEPLGIITRRSTELIPLTDPVLREAVRFMREHACDPCSVEQVLNHVEVSRRWLERRFVNQFGRTPHQELTRLRMERGKFLLRTTDMPLSMLCHRCGYSLAQNFSRVFVEVVGCTPGQFRREHAKHLDH